MQNELLAERERESTGEKLDLGEKFKRACDIAD